MHHGRRDDIHLHRCGDSYTEVVAPIDHAWGEPVWEWAEDYSSATATFICERGCGYQEVFTDREIASEETQHASCTQEGKFDHTASVTFNGNEYTDTVTQTTPFVHVTSEAGEYTLGNEHHWKRCTLCGATVKEEHVFEDGAQNCSVCGVTNGSNFVFSAVSGGYSVKQNGKPTFTDTVVLPEYYEAESGDMPITQIGTYGFEWNDSFESIIIPDSVTKIGNYAFQYCRSLKNITLPDSVTEISSYAFSTCTNLTSVTLPENSQFMTISSSLFVGCSALETIVIPESVTSIGEWAFLGCTELKEITIPENVTSIGREAFITCLELASVTFDENSQLTTIGAEAFSGCTSLQEFDAPKNLTSIGEKAFYGCTSLTLAGFYGSSLTALSTSLFEGCTALDDFIPSETLETIGQRAFYGCTAFTTISIPRSTTYIGAYAFYNCNNLGYLSFDDDSDDTYWVNTNGDTFLVSDDPPSRFALYFWSREDYYGYDWTKGESHEHVAGAEIYSGETTHWQKCTICGLVINEDVHTSPTSPEDYTKGSRNHWYYCTVCNYMTTREEHDYMFAVDNQCMVCNVTDPDHLLTFDYYDGRVLDNGAVTTVSTLVLPDYIERYYDVEPTLIPITSVNFGRAEDNAVTTVTKIVLGEFVTVIEDNAFHNLKKLEYVDIPDGVTYIGYRAFSSNPHYYDRPPFGVKNIDLPDSVEYIGEYAFENCAFTSITIPEGVTYIGEYALYNCVNLTSANIPESVTSIPDCMFGGCESLTSIELHDKITSIGDMAFYWSGLTEITLPEGLETIGASAFEITDISAITIPDSVTYIGALAFYSTNLTYIEMTGTWYFELIPGTKLNADEQPPFALASGFFNHPDKSFVDGLGACHKVTD